MGFMVLLVWLNSSWVICKRICSISRIIFYLQLMIPFWALTYLLRNIDIILSIQPFIMHWLIYAKNYNVAQWGCYNRSTAYVIKLDWISTTLHCHILCFRRPTQSVYHIKLVTFLLFLNTDAMAANCRTRHLIPRDMRE